MSTKFSGPSWNDISDPRVDRWIPRLGVLVVLGVLLVTLPASPQKVDAMKAAWVRPSMLHTVGCLGGSPSAVDLLGALEGQPQIPRRGVSTCG
jgi:hypothetical protein